MGYTNLIWLFGGMVAVPDRRRDRGPRRPGTYLTEPRPTLVGCLRAVAGTVSAWT